MALLVLFFDGVGVGVDAPESNPFAAIDARRLSVAAGRQPDESASFNALDATLGVPGLPQSATGQTTLLTGVNAARHAGRHMVGLPGPTLWPLLERESLFSKLVTAGCRATFANAYTRAHLESERPRWSATTRAVQAAGLPFRMLDSDAVRGAALYHDYTGEFGASRGLQAPVHDADSAARVLSSLADQHDFVLYEYFLSDLTGHRGSWDDRVLQAHRVEQLVDAVVREIDTKRHTVAVISDHGNLEDGTKRTHTLNPVPLLVWGRARQELADSATAMERFAPAIEKGTDLFSGRGPAGQRSRRPTGK